MSSWLTADQTDKAAPHSHWPSGWLSFQFLPVLAGHLDEVVRMKQRLDHGPCVLQPALIVRQLKRLAHALAHDLHEPHGSFGSVTHARD
jgi:hypothetical protein